MKDNLIFISWSGKTSQKVALVLRNWIPKLIHDVEPFVSSEDIAKGNIWSRDIFESIEHAKYSIICVTKHNQNSKWLNFEAGALNKYQENGKVCPFLFRLENAEISGPLNQFQTTVGEKNTEEIKKMLVAIRDACGLDKPNDTILDELIVKFYDDLISDLNNITDFPYEDLSDRSAVTKDDNSLFISTPMAGFNNNDKLKSNSNLINQIYEVLENEYSFDYITCPSKNVESDEEFNDKEVAIVSDLRKLQRAEYFLCLYPEPLLSSVLVEIGYSISKGKKCVVIVKKRADLPFILQEADKRVNNFKIYEVEEWENLDDYFLKKSKSIFQFERI